MKFSGINSTVLGLLFSLATSLPSTSADTLVGGVTVNDSLPSAGKLSKLSGEKYDPAKPDRPKGDCICFDRQRVEAKQVNGSWKIVDGDHWILDFANNAENAQLAAKTLREYKMNEICFVGRDVWKPMMFLLADGSAPQGKVDGEDAIGFDPNLVKAEEINGSWKITCGNMWMQDFGPNEIAAKDGAEQIRYFGFTRQCFIGRPGAPMQYFAR